MGYPRIGIGVFVGTNSGGGGYDADAQLYFDELTGVVSNDVKTLVNNLVVTLKADNNWQYIDHLPLLNMPNEQNAMVNLKSPSDLLMVNYNSCVHTPYIGIQGNGTNAYIDTNYNPSTYGGNYQLNSAAYGAGVVTNINDNKTIMGSTSASGYSYIYPRYLGNAIFSLTQISDSTVATATNNGDYLSMRTDSGTLLGYKDGTLLNTFSISITGGIENKNFYLLCNNYFTGASEFTTNQISYSVIAGEQLNAITFRTAIRTFVNAMAAL